MKRILLLCLVGCMAYGGTQESTPLSSPYEKNSLVVLRSEVDQLFARRWGGAPPREASDDVLFRRLHLAVAGRLPTVDESRAYRKDSSPDKFEKSLERLLASDDFVAYYSMYYGDRLRVKSEFPINLWPNAVYVYMRRIRDFVGKDEPVSHFMQALLIGRGSNFRSPEANFFRTIPERNAEKIAEFTNLVLYGGMLRSFPGRVQEDFAALFAGVRWKKTLEWKEEIVYIEPLKESRSFRLPGMGFFSRMYCKAGEDPRARFAETLPHDQAFLAAQIQFLGHIIFGEEPLPPAVIDRLVEELGGNFTVRQAVRRLASSAAFRTTPLGEGKGAFPVRRLEAEVLDDVIRSITGSGRDLASVIPEPFTFLPPYRRTVSVEDGSLSSSFLILFGRPARDSGLWSERADKITAKQRLYLFNSGELYRSLDRVRRRPELHRKSFREQIHALYELFYSREATSQELARIEEAYQKLPNGRAKWRFTQDLAWILVNSKEFLYRH